MVTIGTLLATLMQALDTTIANAALPYMAGPFSASYEQVTWVLTSTIVAAAIMTPPTGWLAARFGRRRLFLVSVPGFTAALALCGLSQSLGQAVIARAAGRVGGRRKKLDPAKRREIPESVLSGRKTGAEMARLYSVSAPAVSRFVAAHRISPA